MAKDELHHVEPEPGKPRCGQCGSATFWNVRKRKLCHYFEPGDHEAVAFSQCDTATSDALDELATLSEGLPLT